MSGSALAVDADLTAVCDDGRTISLAGSGSSLVVVADSLATLRSLRAEPWRDRLREHVAPGLQAAELTIEVRVTDRVVAVADPGRGASWLSHLLGIAPFRVRVGALFALWLGE